MAVHWRKEGIIGLKALMILVIFYYVPIFLWKGVVEIYNNHQQLVRDNASLLAANREQGINNQQAMSQTEQQHQKQIDDLKSTVKQLNADLDDHEQNVHPEDPAFGRSIRLLNMFMVLRHDIGEQTRCEIMVSAPQDGGTSESIKRQLTAMGGLGSKCIFYEPPDRTDPDVEKMITEGTQSGLIVFHTTRADSQLGWATNLWSSLGGCFRLKRSYDMPPPQNIQGGRYLMAPPDMVPTVWLQFGKDVHWTQ